MKIILIKDVIGFGKRGDIKEVKEGYFRNFLLPRKFAEIATTQKLQQIESEAAAKSQAKEASIIDSRKQMDKISGKTLTLYKKVNEKGSLYKSLSKKDILPIIKAQGLTSIPAEWIQLEKPIKESGKSEIEIKNPDGHSIKILVEIKPEK